MARNVVAEAEKKIIAIKSVQPARESHNPSIFMVMIGGNPSIQMAGYGSRFQTPDNNYMLAEALEEYELASEDSAYEDPGQEAPIGFMASVFFTGRIRNTLNLPS